jgi:tetratricopeptide (TPR) repeat protein
LVATINVNLYGSGLVAGTERAVAEVLDCLVEFERVGDVRGAAFAWRVLMLLHGTDGQFDRAAEAAERVVELAAEVGDTRWAASGAVGYATSVLLGSTPVAEAIPRCQDLIAEVQGDRKAEAVILGSLAQLHAMEGRFDLARSLYTESQQLLADLGPSITGASTAFESSRVEMLAGDFSAAEGLLRRDYAQLEAVGERYFRSSIAAFLAQALWASAKFEEADDYARIAEELSDADDVWSQVAWRTVRAKLLARDGRSDDAIALAKGAVDLAAGTSNIDQHADALVDLDAVLRLAGQENETGPPLREALSLYEQKGDLVLAERLRALLEVGAR